MIADEVQTGLGRCGALFACDRDGVVPDVMTLAKGLSGGVDPDRRVRRAAGRVERRVREAPLLHTSTFGGNELACAAALAALDVLLDDDLVANARARGAQLLAGARATMQRYPAVIADVRGAGLLVGVELRSEGYGGTIIPELLKRGVTAAWTLNQQRVIRLEPPLIVTAAKSRRALRAFDGAVAAAFDKLGALAVMPYVECSIDVEAPAATVYELAKEQERFPEFMPDVETVVVLERHPDRVITRWKTLVEDAPIEWTEEDRFDDGALRIDYALIEGDLDTFEGAWTFEQDGTATRVVLGVDYDFGVPTLAELIGPTLEKKVRENSEMMLAALKAEAESRRVDVGLTQSRRGGVTDGPAVGARYALKLARRDVRALRDRGVQQLERAQHFFGVLGFFEPRLRRTPAPRTRKAARLDAVERAVDVRCARRAACGCAAAHLRAARLRCGSRRTCGSSAAARSRIAGQRSSRKRAISSLPRSVKRRLRAAMILRSSSSALRAPFARARASAACSCGVYSVASATRSLIARDLFAPHLFDRRRLVAARRAARAAPRAASRRWSSSSRSLRRPRAACRSTPCRSPACGRRSADRSRGPSGCDVGEPPLLARRRAARARGCRSAAARRSRERRGTLRRCRRASSVVSGSRTRAKARIPEYAASGSHSGSSTSS